VAFFLGPKPTVGDLHRSTFSRRMLPLRGGPPACGRRQPSPIRCARDFFLAATTDLLMEVRSHTPNFILLVHRVDTITCLVSHGPRSFSRANMITFRLAAGGHPARENLLLFAEFFRKHEEIPYEEKLNQHPLMRNKVPRRPFSPRAQVLP